MNYLLVALFAMLAGITQTLTGFGSAIVMMLFLPMLFTIVQASTISTSISFFINGALVLRFYRQANYRLLALPMVVYSATSISFILLSAELDLHILTIVFGGFLMALSAFFLLGKQRVKLRATPASATVCALISGACSGLFSIGGPLMAIYYLEASESKEEYLGTLESFFFLTNIINIITRTAKGLYTADMIFFSLAGAAGILMGKKFGMMIFEKINIATMTRIVYITIGVCGVLTIVTNL